MKNSFKRISKVLLALTLVITMIPFNVYGEAFSYTEIIAPKYEEARTFREGLAAVKKDGKWGFIDEEDNVVIDFQYDMAYSFNENKAVVGTKKVEKSQWSDDNDVNIYWGVINRSGQYKPFIMSHGEHFHDNFYHDLYEEIGEINSKQTNQFYYNGVVMVNRFDDPGQYLFDGNGKEVYGGNFPVHVPTENILSLYNGYVDLKGNQLFKDKSFAQTRPFNQGLAPVNLESDEYWTIMDNKGNIMDNIKMSNFYVKDLYSKYQVFSDNSLLSMSNLDGKWGAVNKEGKTIVPFKYEKLNVFNEGVAGFRINGKFGFIDIYGNEVIKPQFDDVSSFYNGLAAVLQGDNAYIIDKKGKKIEGTENLPKDSYFVQSGHGDYVVYSPGEYVLTSKNSKYGFGKIEYTPSLPTAEEMSNWALEEVILAIENNLVPVNLQNMYRTDITRVDFAALVVKAIEEVKGEDIDKVLKKETGQSLYELIVKYPFKDTQDKNVIAAQALKIIHGRGEEQFAPHDTISRQESAALLMRTAEFLGDETKLESKTFNDHKNIASYAKEAVDYVSSINVMQGKANNNFAPNDSYTREQAYMTIYRLFDVLVK